MPRTGLAWTIAVPIGILLVVATSSALPLALVVSLVALWSAVAQKRAREVLRLRLAAIDDEIARVRRFAVTTEPGDPRVRIACEGEAEPIEYGGDEESTRGARAS
jgi:hypothetical protein